MNENIFCDKIGELQGTVNSNLGDEVITKKEWDEDPFSAVVRHLLRERQEG